jgi:quercetin dioxygenase-like cupin family protein
MKGGKCTMVVKRHASGIVEMLDGISRQSLAYGERTHLVKFFLQKDKLLPLHTHEHEQTGYLMEGKMVMTIDGKDHTLEPGDCWSIGGNVPHSAKILEDCVVIEVFSPVRTDDLM